MAGNPGLSHTIEREKHDCSLGYIHAGPLNKKLCTLNVLSWHYRKLTEAFTTSARKLGLALFCCFCCTCLYVMLAATCDWESQAHCFSWTTWLWFSIILLSCSYHCLIYLNCTRIGSLTSDIQIEPKLPISSVSKAIKWSLDSHYRRQSCSILRRLLVMQCRVLVKSKLAVFNSQLPPTVRSHKLLPSPSWQNVAEYNANGKITFPKLDSRGLQTASVGRLSNWSSYV